LNSTIKTGIHIRTSGADVLYNKFDDMLSNLPENPSDSVYNYCVVATSGHLTI